jgi:hypothetical protein
MSRSTSDIVRPSSNTVQTDKHFDQDMANAFVTAISNRTIETVKRRLAAKHGQKLGQEKPNVTCAPIHNAQGIRANGKSIIKWARSHKAGPSAAYEHIRVDVQHSIARRLRLPKQAVQVDFDVDHGRIDVDFGGHHVVRA